MNPRLIKFRGRVPDSDKIDGGKIVFGSLVIYNEDGMYPFWIYPPNGDRNYPVEPDSIAQFAGIDEDGQEVYSGDIFCHSPEGRPISAELAVVLIDNQGKSYYFTKDILRDVPFPY